MLLMNRLAAADAAARIVVDVLLALVNVVCGNLVMLGFILRFVQFSCLWWSGQSAGRIGYVVGSPEFWSASNRSGWVVKLRIFP